MREAFPREEAHDSHGQFRWNVSIYLRHLFLGSHLLCRTFTEVHDTSLYVIRLTLSS